jgi:hypothetical protein
LIRPEFTNHLLVEIIQFRHISSLPHAGYLPLGNGGDTTGQQQHCHTRPECFAESRHSLFLLTGFSTTERAIFRIPVREVFPE